AHATGVTPMQDRHDVPPRLVRCPGRVALLAALCAAAWPVSAAEPARQKVPPDHAEQMARGQELFAKHVRGILTQHCVKCHGGEKLKGDFDLTTRESLLKGNGGDEPLVV